MFVDMRLSVSARVASSGGPEIIFVSDHTLVSVLLLGSSVSVLLFLFLLVGFSGVSAFL